MKNIFLTLITLFLITSCSEDREDLNIVNEDLNNELMTAKLNLESKLNTYKGLLNKNNTSFASKESLTILNSVLNITSNKKKSISSKTINLTENQIAHIAYLGSLLSNSESPEAALEILEEDYEAISTSEIFTDNEKNILLIVNNSIKISTKFVVGEFDNNNKNSSLAKRKSWWNCLKTAYADLTDDFVGTMALAVFPEFCVPAIIVGGTINYYMQ